MPAAHPYPQAARQDTPADPQRSEISGTHEPEMGDTPKPDPRRSEPQNSSPAAARPNPLPAAANQRSFASPTGRRPETVGVAKVRPLLPGLQLQPMVHVDDMPAAVAFYEKLGGEINHGDRDGEWVLMQVGTSQIGLVTRPPDASRGESTVELNFTATMPLDRLEQLLRAQGVTVVEVAVDRDLGVRLHVETPDGMPIKIHQVEPELMV
ncbi:VOC family protein [Actinoplanes sp. CA-051413]|uniref:VOC family protein n=1 Tax=Actinoplanes sp. CA-051413 TaxID=3239899 RepID=UPI003D996B64